MSRSDHSHPHDHSLAAVFAHTHDAHPPEPAAAAHGHRPAMVGTPARRCEFESDEPRLALLYRALSGRPGELVPYDDPDLVDVPDTVHTLHLPAHAPIDEHHGLTRPEWYRVAIAHRALHHLLGTYDVDLARLSRGGAPAVEIFVTLEDLRIDAVAQRLLPGLAASYRLACHEALHDRPPLSMLPARDALAEALVQFSLGAAGVVAPAALDAPLARLISVTRRLLDPSATAEWSAEAAIRIHEVIAALPEGAAYRSARAVTFDDLDVPVDETHPAAPAPHAEEQAAITFYPVAFRDSPAGRYARGDPASGLPLEHPVLRPAESDDSRPGEADDDDAGSGRPTPGRAGDRSALPTSGRARVLPDAPRPIRGTNDAADRDRSGGRLCPAAANEYVYPEWDGVAGRYRDRWCLVRVSRAPSAPSQRRHRVAMARYGHLLPGLVAALERVQPAGRDIVLRRPHGDDLDLDACIEAVIDLRAGIEPSDLVFASTQQRRRDVAVAFAIDLSASTAEVLPPDPDEPNRVQRTLDLQRDAVSLVAEALDRVGDAYGIYGFSGAGRDDVRLSVVKDVDERRSPGTLRRLEGLVPDHTTRMGPAIRHLADRLTHVAAATKVLLIVSDGRPFDIDYGQEYGEAATVEYALADTGQALDEARHAGVRPYLVTIDSSGADYLSRICDPREYHVISEARDLPRSLGELYVVARTDAFRRRVPAGA